MIYLCIHTNIIVFIFKHSYFCKPCKRCRNLVAALKIDLLGDVREQTCGYFNLTYWICFSGILHLQDFQVKLCVLWPYYCSSCNVKDPLSLYRLYPNFIYCYRFETQTCPLCRQQVAESEAMREALLNEIGLNKSEDISLDALTRAGEFQQLTILGTVNEANIFR